VKALGPNCKAAILQNHGLLTVGQSVDEAAFWFISLDKTCHAQLLVDAASSGSGHKPILINDEEAAFSYTQVGGPEKVSGIYVFLWYLYLDANDW
jgi:ribulose-5-phosphate 4-epimerase/fuculose-1-phosphate aldolase